MSQLVAIVGRPNVGKSTLFNRLTESRQAIVDGTAGTTRDRQYGKVEWGGREFSIVDTGGWVVNSDDIFEEEINKQVAVAIEQADEVLFVVDAMNGVTDLDDHVAEILRKSKKPVLLVANKVDSNDWLYNVPEFYSLGLGDPYAVSAVSGYGTGDLLDEIIQKLPEPTEDGEELEEFPKFAIVGRPNAGKSSLINAFIGEDRHIVTDIAGTTRDSIYTRYNKFGFDFYLVDTAGIRKKQKVNEDIEYYSVIRSIRAIEASDVCILMIDATRGIEAQDANIFSLIQKKQKGIGCLRQQMGHRRRQIRNGTEALRASNPQQTCPLHRLPHHLLFSPDQTAHLQSIGDRRQRLPEPSPRSNHLAAQQSNAGSHRQLSATRKQRQVHQDQVHNPAQGSADTNLHLLLQPPAVGKRALPPLPREQNPRDLALHRHPRRHLHARKIGQNCRSKTFGSGKPHD
jgi:ribosome-associated GTPase EngA